MLRNERAAAELYADRGRRLDVAEPVALCAPSLTAPNQRPLAGAYSSTFGARSLQPARSPAPMGHQHEATRGPRRWGRPWAGEGVHGSQHASSAMEQPACAAGVEQWRLHRCDGPVSDIQVFSWIQPEGPLWRWPVQDASSSMTSTAPRPSYRIHNLLTQSKRGVRSS